MDIEARPPVVVAVGDEDEHHAAVRFAAGEAARKGRPLHVVHVIDPPLLGPGPEHLLLTFEDVELVGEELLRAATDQAERVVAGRVPVKGRLEQGPVVPLLVQAGEQADCVVLQHRHLAGLRRIVTGSVCAGVAGRAHVPVVSVPELWTGDESVARVVVGADGTVGSQGLLETAFALAAERKASLVVLHAWFIPSVYHEAIIGRAGVERARERTRSRIADEMAVWQATYPSVEARLDIAQARPADALMAASEDSDLLVLARRSNAHSHLSHLGSVTRALLRESTCPVMVLPPRTARVIDAGRADAGDHRKT